MSKKLSYKCPKCKSENIIPIVWGYPTQELLDDDEAGRVISYGDLIPPNPPDSHCKSCGHEWMNNPESDYVTVDIND